jgi:hypothetical protein
MFKGTVSTPNFTPPYPACTQDRLPLPDPHHRSDRSSQNRGVAHTALKGATRQLPSLGVSLHHFPPLCISADKLDTAGAEVKIRMV